MLNLCKYKKRKLEIFFIIKFTYFTYSIWKLKSNWKIFIQLLWIMFITILKGESFPDAWYIGSDMKVCFEISINAWQVSFIRGAVLLFPTMKFLIKIEKNLINSKKKVAKNLYFIFLEILKLIFKKTLSLNVYFDAQTTLGW